MEKKVTAITERIDDIVLLLNVMMQMGLPQLLNQHLPRHWKQQGLDWGWVATIWLSYIMSESDHRKVMVREWVNQRRYMLEQVCGIEISDTDFTDDRLAIVLKQLSQEDTWALHRANSDPIHCTHLCLTSAASAPRCHHYVRASSAGRGGTVSIWSQ